MMSIFNIGNANGGIRDPVVHLKNKSCVMEMWEGKWMDLFVQYQLPADYWLTGRLQASGKKEGKDIVVL